MDRRIGAQYYTLREHIQTIEDFEETCRKVKEIGYKIVQISGTPLGAAEMKVVLDKYDLKVVVTHRDFNEFLSNLDEIIDYNKTLGCDICGIGGMPGEYRGSKEAVTAFIEGVNAAAKKLREAGLYFGYHNHAFEFAKFDGKLTMERLIEETDPETVKFIVDTYWLQVGGVNPAKYIERIGERAMAVHFKDLIGTTDNKQAMAEVGQGNLNWDEIIAACEEAGTKWALVEQDICQRDPFECMTMSYKFLKNKGFN